MEVNGVTNEMQSGFTRQWGLEDDIFSLNYCTDNAKRRKIKLSLTAIDFADAFNSINREKLIQALREYKCDPQLIMSIAKLHSGDETCLYLNCEQVCETGVTSCSPQLFAMVVNL